jgi:hypothetical protein
VTTPTLFPRRRLAAFVGTVVLLASAVAALAVPGTAMASVCGEKVLQDWFDNGRIDRVYPLHCYEEAIDSIPADFRDYSDAEDVIMRALQSAGRGGTGGSAPPSRNPSDTPSDPTSPSEPGRNPATESPSGPTADPTSEAVPDVTSDPSSLPIPLLILGGMSLALLGAGGLGYLSRRRRADDADTFGDDDLVA